MTIMNKTSKVLVKRLAALFVAMGLAFGVSAGGARVVSALSAPSFRWQTFTLPASSTIARSTVWTSNSTGALSWKAFGGGCERKGENIVTFAGGVCKVRVTYGASKIHSAIDTERAHSVVPLVTTTSRPPVTTTSKPPITAVPKPTVAPTTTAAPVTRSCALGGVCKLGDIGPGGGTVFYVASKPFESTRESVCYKSCRYLEAAPTDIGVKPGQAASVAWCLVVGSQGGFLQSLPSLGLQIGSGMKNTMTMMDRSRNKPCAIGAIKIAHDYSSRGKSDWHLPSFEELKTLCNYVRIEYRVAPGTTCGSRQGLSSLAFSKTFHYVNPYWSSSTGLYSTAEIALGQKNIFLPCSYPTAATLSCANKMGDSELTNAMVRPVRAF